MFIGENVPDQRLKFIFAMKMIVEDIIKTRSVSIVKMQIVNILVVNDF